MKSWSGFKNTGFEKSGEKVITSATIRGGSFSGPQTMRSTGAMKQFKVKNITIERFPEVEGKLRDILGTKISILYDGKKGNISIEFYGKEDLRRIAGLLLKEK